jgi:hypothetical protein
LNELPLSWACLSPVSLSPGHGVDAGLYELPVEQLTSVFEVEYIRGEEYVDDKELYDNIAGDVWELFRVLGVKLRKAEVAGEG